MAGALSCSSLFEYYCSSSIAAEFVVNSDVMAAIVRRSSPVTATPAQHAFRFQISNELLQTKSLARNPSALPGPRVLASRIYSGVRSARKMHLFSNATYGFARGRPLLSSAALEKSM